MFVQHLKPGTVKHMRVNINYVMLDFNYFVQIFESITFAYLNTKKLCR